VVGPGGEKLAGVLAESRGLRADGPAVFVLGVGLNVEGGALSDELRSERPVASLRELGAEIGLEEAEERLAAALERCVDRAASDPRAAYSAFFERCALARREVVVGGPECDVDGVWTALDPALGLRVEAADGRARHVSVAHARSVRSLEGGDGR
jgi:biotin-(acetyl-CoA carboxylase) ligase